MDIFQTKTCPVTGLELEIKDNWQLNQGRYSCKIGVIAKSIIISEPVGYSNKETTMLFLKTFAQIIESYPNTQKFVLIDNYSNFKEASKEARREYISFLNNNPKIAMIIYMGLSKKLYLSVNIGKMINYLCFPIKISKNYNHAILESIKKLKNLNIKNSIPYLPESNIEKEDFEVSNIDETPNLSEILKNPYVNIYIDEFNKYLTNIKWNNCDYQLPIIEGIDENHPLTVLREALSIIKSDVSELIKDFIEQNTILKRTQKNLEDLNINLEELVKIRTRELAESNRKLKIAKEEAEIANKGKAVFLASISHELKTPLNSILSYSSMGVSKIEKLSKNKLINYFSQINKSGKRLLKLLESLIDITKFEAGAMNFNFSKNNIISIINRTISELSALSHEKEINIKIINKLNEEEFIFDKDRLMQVFVNIISNAIKFTPNNSKIIIILEENDNNFICKIIDEGVGIKLKDKNLIFDVFKRGENSNNASGTGLGLAISKNIIIAHNGKIWADNNEGVGSNFNFIISKNLELSKIFKN